MTSKDARAQCNPGAGVQVGPELYTDALGPVGSEGESYVKMIKYNVGVFQKYLK